MFRDFARYRRIFDFQVMLDLLLDEDGLLLGFQAPDELDVLAALGDRRNRPAFTKEPRQLFLGVELLQITGLEVLIADPWDGSMPYANFMQVGEYVGSIEPSSHNVVRKPDAHTYMQERKQKHEEIGILESISIEDKKKGVPKDGESGGQKDARTEPLAHNLDMRTVIGELHLLRQANVDWCDAHGSDSHAQQRWFSQETCGHVVE